MTDPWDWYMQYGMYLLCIGFVTQVGKYTIYCAWILWDKEKIKQEMYEDFFMIQATNE